MAHEARVVVLEIGAGLAVPTVRRTSEEIARDLKVGRGYVVGGTVVFLSVLSSLQCGPHQAFLLFAQVPH